MFYISAKEAECECFLAVSMPKDTLAALLSQLLIKLSIVRDNN